MLTTKTDVLVVGAGPTGLTVALGLVARGHDVTIIDEQSEGQNTSRASVVYPRTLEVLEPYEVATRLSAQGLHAARFTIRDRDRVLMTVPFHQLPTAYPYTLLVSQAVTEAVLVQRLNEMGARVQRPYKLTGLQQDERGVTATFAGGERMRAKYLVGADGTHSTVRAQTHIGFKTSGSGKSYSLADVHLTGGIPGDGVTVYFSPDGQLVSVPFPDGSFKIVAEVAQAPHQPEADFIQELLDRRGPRTERAVVRDVIWGSRFLVRHGVADHFSVRRVVIAGDAAHDNSPLGGQGMNTGIGDAVALAATLNAALEHDSPATLEAYNATRRPVAKHVVAITNLLTYVATMNKNLRPVRNLILGSLDPILSRNLAWQLSGLIYRQDDHNS